MENTCSMGLRSGEYFGRKRSLAPVANGAADRLAAVTAQIVHDHNLARLERGNKDLPDPGEEHLAIDGTVEKAWRLDPAAAKRGNEGHGLPAPKRCLANHAKPTRPPAAKRRHVGLGPGFINEDEALWINVALIFAPLLTPPFDVRPVLLFCACGFFYGSNPQHVKIPRRSGGPP